jgi:hypothetical protein
MVTAYQGTVQNGQIHLRDDEALPEGAEVYVVIIEKADEPAAVTKPVGITGTQLAESEIVGMWADREDITDSAEFARQLRQRASRRE